MTDVIYVAFPRELYDDLVRFSDGRCDPVEWAVERLEAWIEANFESEADGGGWRNDHFMGLFEDRIEDFALEYYPSVLEYWRRQDESRLSEFEARRRPLVWKDVVVPAGSEVRMSYGGQQYYAKVQDGKIKDGDHEYSPSEWASKVADGTSRSAWRDLWFKISGEASWTPAMSLREKARETLLSRIRIKI